MTGAFVLVGAVVVARAQTVAREPVAPAARVEAAPLVDSWLRDPSIAGRERTASQLVKLGAPVVPAMERLLVERSPAMALALQTLCRVGEAARPALPRMLAVLTDRDFVDPEGHPPHVTARGVLLEAIGDASWAAKELVPPLAAVARDGRETEWVRIKAVLALGPMGSEALPILTEWIGSSRSDPLLRSWSLHALKDLEATDLETATKLLQPIADDPRDPLQDLALHRLFALRDKAGVRTRRDSYSALIDAHPFDEKVRGWLMCAEERDDPHWPDRPDPLVQATKRRWRERLAQAPDAELAWQLAGVLDDQLHGNELGYCGSLVYTPRERSGENHETLAQALRLAQQLAEKRSPTWQRATRAQAKLALLRGDWDGMNAELAELGQPPLPADRRPWLAPPPKDWSDLADHWQPCDAVLRSGDCAFEVSVETDGRGARGAHVLLREMPPETNVFSTGYDPRTLFNDSTPLGWGRPPDPSGFGYEGDDRNQCRYAVTGDDGIARFERLPAIEVAIEVMIPTANFEETFSRWDLYVRQPDGSLELDHYRWREGFRLAAGATVQGPRLVVRPHRSLNVANGEALAASEFELEWPTLPETPTSGAVRYEVELAVSFPPCELLVMNADAMPRLSTATAQTRGSTWPLRAQGVGGLKLVPGNVYLVQVTAIDERGASLSRFGRVWCYVPWSHRVATGPLVRDLASEPAEFDDFPPIEPELWHLGEFHDSSGRVETLPERLERFLRERPAAFEVEYVRVARAWLAWRDGQVDAARAELSELAAALPGGNVAGETARELLRKIERGDAPEPKLRYVAPP